MIIVGKRGQVSGVGLLTLIVLISVFLAITYSVLSTEYPPAVDILDSLPDGIEKIVEIYKAILTPIFNVVKLVAIPDDFRGSSDELTNEGMIAIGIFFLLSLVGYHVLGPVFGPSKLIGSVISIIIGVIASRSLTTELLEAYPIGASPIAAAAFLIGILPIFMIQKLLSQWFGEPLTDSRIDPILLTSKRLAVWVLCAVIYWFIFSFGFDAKGLGWFYSIGIVLFGIGDLVWTFLSGTARRARNIRIGEWMQSWANTFRATREAYRGATNNTSRRRSNGNFSGGG